MMVVMELPIVGDGYEKRYSLIDEKFIYAPLTNRIH